MKMILGLFAILMAIGFGGTAEAQAVKQSFQKQVHFAVTGCAAGNQGNSYAAPKCFGDVDVWAIPAGVVIEKVYTIIDTAITGTTDFDIGDDDQSDDFLDGSVSLTIGTAGMYGWNAKVAGAYLRVQTAGATDAADIYVVPNAKYYSASGKEVKMDATGAATAGQARIVIEGYYVGPKQP
jgi:hypothetical protein